MRAHRVGSTLAVGFAVLSVMLSEQSNAQSSTTNPYRSSFGWEHLSEGREMGTVSGVHPDPDGQHLWILDRCGGNQCAGTDLDPIMKFDLDGNLVDSFGAGALRISSRVLPGSRGIPMGDRGRIARGQASDAG